MRSSERRCWWCWRITGGRCRSPSPFVVLTPSIPSPFGRGETQYAGPSHLRESRSFAPAALRMTGSLASRGKEEPHSSLSFLQTARGACHPERARGTRESEGPAVARHSQEAGPSHLRESRSFAPAALRMTSSPRLGEGRTKTTPPFPQTAKPRASEGPAVARHSQEAGPSHLRESRS